MTQKDLFEDLKRRFAIPYGEDGHLDFEEVLDRAMEYGEKKVADEFALTLENINSRFHITEK